MLTLGPKTGSLFALITMDGLTGFPEAIETVFPRTQVQLCLVHVVRNSLKYVNYKQRAEVAKDLKAMYSAATEVEAEFNLELFAEKWDKQYPAISKSWRAHWSRIIPLFSYPEEIRKVIQVIWNTPRNSGILGFKEHRPEELSRTPYGQVSSTSCPFALYLNRKEYTRQWSSKETFPGSSFRALQHFPPHTSGSSSKPIGN